MKPNTNYTLADRLMHRLALGNTAIAELTFDLDQKVSRARDHAAHAAMGKHVFVTGLARAGTTVLMRAIHDSGMFRSLTYRDMPFPLAPCLGKRFLAGWQLQARPGERAQGDRILTDADSPEALDEVFWRVFSGYSYIRRDGLQPYHPSRDAIERFHAYVAAILLSAQDGQDRYLSKNNNNILRLPALLEAFPHAAFVIPFRRPADQASSLWRQHRRFCALQRKQPFVRSYMDWLVHHEFGLGHRPFRLGFAAAAGLEPGDPAYWLETWIGVHEALLALDDPRCLFVCHEALCELPDVWLALAANLALPANAPVPHFCASSEPAEPFDRARLAHADALYGAMRDKWSGAAWAQKVQFSATADIADQRCQIFRNFTQTHA